MKNRNVQLPADELDTVLRGEGFGLFPRVDQGHQLLAFGRLFGMLDPGTERRRSLRRDGGIPIPAGAGCAEDQKHGGQREND